MRFPSNHYLEKKNSVFHDSSLTMSKQVINLSRTAYLENRKSGIIRPFLNEKATTQLVCSGILNRPDYYNSLLAGTNSEQMSRIQRVQNSAAKLILKWKRRDHATSHIKKYTLASSKTKHRFKNYNISLQILKQRYTLLLVSWAYC